MHIFRFFLFIGLLLPLSAQAEYAQLFTLHRVNYKPEKQLRYDLDYNKKTCEINTSQAIRAYYVSKKSGKKLSAFSSSSKKYFSPHWDKSNPSKTQVTFHFRALNEMKNTLGLDAQITVFLDKVNNECQVTSQIAYGNKQFDLKHIEVTVVTFLGLPIGAQKVSLFGVFNGESINDTFD